MVMLRDLTLADEKDFFYAAWSEAVYRYIRGFYCDSLERARSIINELINGDSNRKAFVIEADEHFVGVLVVCNKGEKAIELSYFVDERYRRKGYAFQAIEKLIPLYKGYKIFFQIERYNQASLGVMRKFNCKCDFEDPDWYYFYNE